MRQWYVPTECMCRQHLLGEHCEHHMFVGTLKKGRSVKTYIDKGFLVPRHLKDRHDEIVKEMEARGYNHKTPCEDACHLFDDEALEIKMTVSYFGKSMSDLLSRCERCYERSFKYFKGKFPLKEEMIKLIMNKWKEKGDGGRR